MQEQIVQGQEQLKRGKGNGQRIEEAIKVLQKQLPQKIAELSGVEGKISLLKGQLGMSRSSLESSEKNLNLILTSENVDENSEVIRITKRLNKNRDELSALLSDKVREEVRDLRSFQEIGGEDGLKNLFKAFEQTLVDEKLGINRSKLIYKGSFENLCQ